MIFDFSRCWNGVPLLNAAFFTNVVSNLIGCWRASKGASCCSCCRKEAASERRWTRGSFLFPLTFFLIMVIFILVCCFRTHQRPCQCSDTRSGRLYSEMVSEENVVSGKPKNRKKNQIGKTNCLPRKERLFPKTKCKVVRAHQFWTFWRRTQFSLSLLINGTCIRSQKEMAINKA